MGSLLAIDPGQSMGWAYWNKASKKPSWPDAMGVERTHGDSWTQQVMDQCLNFRIGVPSKDVDQVVCELPEYFATSVKGHAVASKQGLVKLTCIVGAIMGVCQFRRISVRVVPVREWKGQMKKETVKLRILRRLPGLDDHPDFHHDAIDAVGIGGFHMGWF